MRVSVLSATGLTVVLVMGACSGNRTTAGSTALPEDPAELEGHAGPGRVAYAHECAACHGARGQGVVASDFRDSAVARDFARTVLRVSYGSQGMTPFADRLSNQQIADVAAYVNQLARAR